MLAFLPWGIYNAFVTPGEALWFLNFSVFPLNSIGFINAIIYVRPRYVRFRRENSNVGVVLSVWYTLARSRPPRSNLVVTERRTTSVTRLSSSLGNSISVIGQRLSSFFFRPFPKGNGNSVKKENNNMDCVDESSQAELVSRKDDDTKFPIDLRNIEEEKHDVIKGDSFVEEGLVACELEVSRVSSGEMMMGAESDSFEIQDNEVESISGSNE